jgi:hypothetical protein
MAEVREEQKGDQTPLSSPFIKAPNSIHERRALMVQPPPSAAVLEIKFHLNFSSNYNN